MNFENIDLNICNNIARDVGNEIDPFSAGYENISRFPTNEKKIYYYTFVDS